MNQQVSWAVPGIAVADSHVYVQGQPGYKPAPTGRRRRRPIPPPTSSTSTDRDRRRGERELPGDAGARPGGRVLTASGLVRAAGASRMYHSAFGVPFTLHLVVRRGATRGRRRRHR